MEQHKWPTWVSHCLGKLDHWRWSWAYDHEKMSLHRYSVIRNEIWMIESIKKNRWTNADIGSTLLCPQSSWSNHLILVVQSNTGTMKCSVISRTHARVTSGFLTDLEVRYSHATLLSHHNRLLMTTTMFCPACTGRVLVWVATMGQWVWAWHSCNLSSLCCYLIPQGWTL